MRISLIAAASENNVLGKEGKIPWRLPADMRRMKALTMGRPLIMGRRTYASIGRPLPGRRNIVVTRSDHAFPGCDTAHSLDEALNLARAGGAEETFIFGGAEMYLQALPLADRIELTRVHGTFDGDAFFPTISPKDWAEVARERHEADAENPFPYTFLTYERRKDARKL